MYRRIKNRLISLALLFITVTLGTSLILYSLKQNITFFYPPSKINMANEQMIRAGGLVKEDSLKQLSPETIEFIITDKLAELIVRYTGLIPAMFRENQGVVLKGRIINGIFISKEMLIKHDENYQPPETAK